MFFGCDPVDLTEIKSFFGYIAHTQERNPYFNVASYTMQSVVYLLADVACLTHCETRSLNSLPQRTVIWMIRQRVKFDNLSPPYPKAERATQKKPACSHLNWR